MNMETIIYKNVQFKLKQYGTTFFLGDLADPYTGSRVIKFQDRKPQHDQR